MAVSRKAYPVLTLSHLSGRKSGRVFYMTRNDLANTFSGIGVELGVASGDYSAKILTNSSVFKLYSIDRWIDHHDDREYHRACDLLGRFGSMSEIIRDTFANAVNQFRDGYFNFIYIDGYAHTGQERGQTLRDWWPKLAGGGIFSGHDYDPHYQPTIEAVDEFASLNRLAITVTSEPHLPSWFCVKPIRDN